MSGGSWDELISHSHWFTLTICDRSIRICARCSGVALGFLASVNILRVIEDQITRLLPMEYLLLASLCLAAPAIVDWITQAWGLRESTNRLRLVTGFLEGVGAALLALLTIPLTYKITLLASIGASVLFIGRIANGWSVQGSLFSPNGRAHQK